MCEQDEEVRGLDRADRYGDYLNASDIHEEPRRCSFRRAHGTRENFDGEHVCTIGEHSCGMLKKAVSKAAASEDSRRTLWGTLRV